MTDAGVVALSTSIAAIVGGLPLIIKARSDARRERRRQKIEDEDRAQAKQDRLEDREALKKVAARAETATQETADTLKRLVKTTDNTHVLVNSQYAAALRLVATTARALADTTGKPEHILLAANAEDALAEHMRRQAVVDQKGATP